MSARVFEIDELARLISSHLLTDRPTLVSLACTCRVLEVPALSSLWITQRSFTTLINLLPVKDEEVQNQASDPVSALTSSIGFRAQHPWKCVGQVPEVRELDTSTAHGRGRPPGHKSYGQSPLDEFTKRTAVSKLESPRLLCYRRYTTAHPPPSFSSSDPPHAPQLPRYPGPRSGTNFSGPTDSMSPGAVPRYR